MNLITLISDTADLFSLTLQMHCSFTTGSTTGSNLQFRVANFRKRQTPGTLVHYIHLSGDWK